MKNETLERMSIVRRIPCYRNKFSDILAHGGTVVSLKDLAARMQINRERIQKDLQCCGVELPQDGLYKMEAALDGVDRFLSTLHPVDVLFVGSGLLGELLLNCDGFAGAEANVLASFNANPEKKELEDRERNIFPLDKLFNLASRLQTKTGIICVPHHLAQDITNMMVDAGLTGIWNWSGIPVRVPKDIALYNEELSDSIMVNAYFKIK